MAPYIFFSWKNCFHIIFLKLTGGKAIDPLEGGIRIPGILRWPKMIVPKTQLDLPTSLLDFRETINEIISRNNLASVSGRGNLSTDGISYFNSIINNGSAEVFL